MVRDHKVVGSNPVASTINKGVAFATPLFISWLGTMGFEVREVGGSPPTKQSGRLFSVRVAQGANPVAIL